MIGGIDRLVNQQILRWQEERRIAERTRPGRSSDLPKPNLTVSRQFGARGAELGQRVATDLGFRFYSQELIHFIAQESRVGDQVVESLDERVRAGVPRRVAELLKGNGFTPSDYLRNLSRVVTALGRMGGGVIIGRGAHLLLEQSLTLRIRVIAPLDRRIERVAQKYHLPESVARAKIQRIDDERVAFNRQHYGVDVGDPSHYDLVINTGLLPIETCTRLVITAFRARFADA